MSSVFKNQFVPHNGKIADITHTDINHHTITMASMGLPPNVALIILQASRISGSGTLDIYPARGTTAYRFTGSILIEMASIAITDGLIEYNLNTANDDWDIYCLGYWTQRSRR